ncbi:MAG: XdhC family protein [Deferribacterales bacterium]
MDRMISEKLAEYVRTNTPSALITVINSEGSSPAVTGYMMTVAENGETSGTIGGGRLEHLAVSEALECIRTGVSKEAQYNLKADADMACGGSVRIFIRVFSKSPVLYIVGAGHIGTQLYHLGSEFGFSTVIVDDRADMADRALFPEASEVICGDMEQVLKSIEFDDLSYIAIATRSHHTDENALFAVAGSQAKYIGMIGSTSKIRKIFGNLKDRSVGEEALKRVYAPMGLNIADTNPKEIALSILSEMMLVKNSGSADHMRDLKKIW